MNAPPSLALLLRLPLTRSPATTQRTHARTQDVAGECGVSAMPTFQVWKDGAKVDELIGASQVKLKELVARHAA